MFYSQIVFIMFSNMSTGPVADMILSGWPENKANKAFEMAPDNMHSIVAFEIQNWKNFSPKIKNKPVYHEISGFLAKKTTKSYQRA